MNSKGIALDLIVSFVVTIIVLTALSPLIVAFDTTFLTGTGVNSSLMGTFYYLIYGVPLFLAIAGIMLIVRQRTNRQN